MHVFKPGDRVHFDGNRSGVILPEGHDEYEPPAWGTVVTHDEVAAALRGDRPLPDRTPVRWDEAPNGYVVTEPLTACLVPADEAPEPDPKES